MHLVGFITRKFVTIHGHMNVKKKSDLKLTRQFAVFWAVTPRTFKQSLWLINTAESSKTMVPICHPHESATNLPNYVALR